MGALWSSSEYELVNNTEVLKHRPSVLRRAGTQDDGRREVFSKTATDRHSSSAGLGSSSPLPGFPCVDEASFGAHLAAGKAMDVLLMKAKGTCQIEQGSVYGAAVAIPQYARTSGWSLHYTALAFRSYFFLIANISLQGFLLYMISKEERINDKFTGQMHLCNMGAGIPDCSSEDAPNCIGPLGSVYKPERLYDWKMWHARNFVRESFEKMFPDRIDEIREKVDPGEYGLESYYLRLACHLLFVMGLWPDLIGSWQLILLLIHVPTAHEPWMLYNGPEKDRAVHANSRLLTEAANVDFMVAGMPLHWKFINFVCVVVPKLMIWILMMDVGTLFLMETAGIEDMILNAVALSFILNIDELICLSLFSDSSKQMLESCLPLPLFEPADAFEADVDVWERHQMHRQWNILSPEFWYYVFSGRLFCMLGVTVFFQYKYFSEHCVLLSDGSWIPHPLYLPKFDSLDFRSFFFGPFPKMFPVPTREEAFWTWHGQGATAASGE